MKKRTALRHAVVLVVLTFLLSSCATMSNKQKAFWRGATVGAAAGGVTGGVIGNQDDSEARDKGALLGVVVGGLIGGTIGMMTAEEEKPAPAPPAPEVKAPAPVAPPPAPPAPKPMVVEKPKVKERVVLRGITFDFDKAEIKPEFTPVLDVAVSILKERPDVKVVVEGHTCDMGPDAYNQKLSERRAKAVYTYLARQGVKTDNLSVVGLGETQPIADNKTRSGRELNRRVEFKVME